MAYTSHGHQIPMTPVEEPAPTMRARCGGPGLCRLCSNEAFSMIGKMATQHQPTLLKNVPAKDMYSRDDILIICSAHQALMDTMMMVFDEMKGILLQSSRNFENLIHHLDTNEQGVHHRD